MRSSTFPTLKIALIIFCVAILCTQLASVSEAQESDVRDLTDEDPTVAMLIEALRPKNNTSGVRARGLSESRPQPVSCKIFLETRQRGVAGSGVALKVLFALNSDELAPSAETTLRTLGEAISSPELESFCIGVEGHTDSTGGERYNLQLSRRRAERVKVFLVEEFDIDPDRLLISGYGESQPLASNEVEEGRRRNRRVQIKTLGTGS